MSLHDLLQIDRAARRLLRREEAERYAKQRPSFIRSLLPGQSPSAQRVRTLTNSSTDTGTSVDDGDSDDIVEVGENGACI